MSGNPNGGFGTIYVQHWDVASATSTTASMGTTSIGPAMGGGVMPFPTHPHTHSELVLATATNMVRLVEPPDAKLTPLDGVMFGGAVLLCPVAWGALHARSRNY